MTKPQTFANVWDAIEDSREEAATMTMRSNVMIAINEKVRSWNTTQLRAAHRLGITQPRLNDLLHGKIKQVFVGHPADFGNTRGSKGQDRCSVSRLTGAAACCQQAKTRPGVPDRTS